ncbi:hypothetical protein EVAR_67754_1 [Eumeta japonica]|uniref:Uncharacterized protein n=1 Tax=Eumeta variegata TaxID=151549 RepID=A0A4C1ZDY3_EUMVA|nr:hypothetical protein EVAR_67754_1 [Eumeta japonica]
MTQFQIRIGFDANQHGPERQYGQTVLYHEYSYPNENECDGFSWFDKVRKSSVAGILDRNKINDGGRSGLMEMRADQSPPEASLWAASSSNCFVAALFALTRRLRVPADGVRRWPLN